MKRILTMILSGALISAICAAFVACNSNGEQKQTNETRAVSASADVTAFFDEHLPATSGAESDCFFINDKANKYLTINNAYELQEIVSYSTVEIPSIDFGQYSLVVGQYWMGGTGYHVTNHGITIGSEKMELNLTVKIPEGSYAMLCPFYYWGLYPKLPNAPINVNIVYEGNPL